MKVLFASGEAAPFFKTGGLGDVAYALPKEMVKQGVDVRVVLPNYSQMPQKYQEQLTELVHFRFQLGDKNVYCGIKTLNHEGILYYFVDNLSYFDRAGIYGEWDDGERFGFFSTAIIEMLEVIDWIPDIIHCNDWHTAMVPVLLVDRYHWKERLRNIRKILTIHNLRFQGVFDPSILTNVFGTGYNTYTEDGLKYFDRANFLKGGINFSDRVTTVSPTYAMEITTPAFGENLDEVLRYNNWKVHGIINGIDYDLNNPSTDPMIPHHFDAKDLSGKYLNKAELQKQVGLPVKDDVPLIGIVSRLTDQKGFQLIEELLDGLLHEDVQVVLLGTGDPHFEQAFHYFGQKYPDKMSSNITFDVKLAQLIYAGSDLFLMPSAFEPCGLSQMMSMRYGTLPIVHETGGLKDTVEPYNKYTGEGTGFSFYGFNTHNLWDTIQRALDVYRNNQFAWRTLVQNAMNKDFSWEKPTEQYIALYQELLDE